MQNFILEIAANSFQSCLSAVEGGADRIELFENLSEGGCTPSFGLLQVVKEKINLPIYVMIRPRGGDFIYTNEEFEIMKNDIQVCKNLNFEGVVFGILNSDGTINVERNETLINIVKPMKATFHRAFDRCDNLETALEQIIALGFERVLTSGGAADVDKGKEKIKDLQRKYGHQIIIMPGCGVNAENVSEIIRFCNVTEIHATAKSAIPSKMKFHKNHFEDKRHESGLETIVVIKNSLKKNNA